VVCENSFFDLEVYLPGQNGVMPRPMVFISHSPGGVILKKVSKSLPISDVCSH
jgi:hypothetical protein